MRRTPAGMEIDEMKRIVVDSSASLYALDGIDFAAVPLKIVTDEREYLSLIHISEPTRRTPISYAVFCLKKKKKIQPIRYIV